jgi:2-keto-4-pentenoate hydratase
VTRATTAARILLDHWQQHTRLDALPDTCRPATRAEGYAVQAQVASLSGSPVAGWKIAATSAAGQRHINVDGPLAGRLLAARQLPAESRISLDGHLMRVAEAEFAFHLAGSLPPRPAAYERDEVLAAVGGMSPAIEVPDSRYTDFTKAGAAQLIADTACSCWFVIGPQAAPAWRDVDLVTHRVSAHRNGESAGDGSGANVLGDPLTALTWIANELCSIGEGLRQGDVVMTGTCVTPVRVNPGDRVTLDFGTFGQVNVTFE